MNTRQEQIELALEQLSKNDPIMASVIQSGAKFNVTPHQDYYSALVGEIIGQQLSTKAAKAIRTRFLAAFNNQYPSPQQISDRSLEDLRATGISWAKAKYVSDLAQHMLDGKLNFGSFDNQSNDEIIKELTAVKGIGEWTAHMFLMFCMGRLDVLPTGDLGIKNGIKKLYGLQEQPDAKKIQNIAKENHWHPYETVACWYVWEALDNTPVID